MRLFVILVLLFCTDGVPLPDDSSLRLVQILFRHGDRSPTHAYPNDPYQESSWPQGFGQLTKEGKEQMYAVGKYIRSRYVDTGYLSANYTQTEVHIQSTDKDRTLMSASLVLAGLYKPEGDQSWDTSIHWQPIPVHTLPLSEDFLLALDCPAYDKLYAEMMNSPPILKIQEKHRELINYVSRNSGLNATLTDLLEIIDPVNCERKTKKTLPKWLNNSTVENILQLYDLKAQLRFRTPELSRIRGGPLLGGMLQNMHELVTSQNVTRKAFIYSAHDTTINAFLSALKMFNDLHIPTGSSVYVELHEINNTPVVQIYYRNNTAVDPYLLKIPGCAVPCPLSQLESLSKDMIPENPKSTCEGSDSKSQHGVSGTTVGVTVLTLVILVSILAMLAVNMLRERRRQSMYRYSPVNQHM